MARMSIDDMVARDPRITLLATTIGWSRRETVGCLVMDIWPICYDQEHWLISEKVIDAAAGLVGFAAAMIECELASRDKGGKVHIAGAKERIKYLEKKKDAGREGGLKSAESRRNRSKQNASTGGSNTQASRNPPVPDPSSAPAPDPVPPPAPPQEEEDSAPPAPPKLGRKTRLPDGWVPERSTANVAAETAAKTRGVDLRAELEQLRDWAKGESARKADWDATWRNWIRRAATRLLPRNHNTQSGLDFAKRVANGEA